MLETTRRAELEERALEEARLTDAGERGVPVEQTSGV
jgi:NADH dehydrogenase